MSDEIHKERRRIAYRLCGFVIPLSEIAVGTGLSENEVLEIQQLRNDYYNKKTKEDPRNFFYAKSWELDDIEKESSNEQKNQGR